MTRHAVILAVLLAAGCVSGPPPVAPPPIAVTNAPTAPVEWFPGLQIAFPNLPDAATAAAMAEAGAFLSPGGTGRVWSLPRYDRHNQFQQTALEAAMMAGATIGPLR